MVSITSTLARAAAVDVVEKRLKARARRLGLKGERYNAYVFGPLQHAGLMHGNQPTQKGLAHYVARRRSAS